MQDEAKEGARSTLSERSRCDGPKKFRPTEEVAGKSSARKPNPGDQIVASSRASLGKTVSAK